MIYPGTDLKFMVSVSMEDFDIDENDMELTITNRWGNVTYNYKSEDFYTDGNGRWLFTMPHVDTGVYYAKLTCYRNDADFEGGVQSVTDVRHLVTVGMCDCCMSEGMGCGCGETDGMSVTYERVYSVNIINGIYLTDNDGKPILDENGNYILFTGKTKEDKRVRLNVSAEEFKKWFEERDDNGKTDTRLEVEDAINEGKILDDISITDEELEDVFYPSEDETEEG